MIFAPRKPFGALASKLREVEAKLGKNNVQANKATRANWGKTQAFPEQEQPLGNQFRAAS